MLQLISETWRNCSLPCTRLKSKILPRLSVWRSAVGDTYLLTISWYFFVICFMVEGPTWNRLRFQHGRFIALYWCVVSISLWQCVALFTFGTRSADSSCSQKVLLNVFSLLCILRFVDSCFILFHNLFWSCSSGLGFRHWNYLYGWTLANPSGWGSTSISSQYFQ